MDITPFKYFLTIGNLLCVFRNYLLYKRFARILITIWIFFEIFSLTLNSVLYYHYRSSYWLSIIDLYVISVTGFSLILIILAIYHSRKMKRLLSNFDNYHNYVGDTKYCSNLKQIQKKSLIFFLLYLCIKSIIMFLRSNNYGDNLTVTGIFVIFYVYVTSVCDVRFIFEYFIIYCIFRTISEQLDAISRSIDLKMETFAGNRESGQYIAIYSDQVKCFDKWIEAYNIIKDCTDLTSAIFGTQLTLMLTIVTIYYIMLLYYIIIQSVAEHVTVLEIVVNLYILVLFFLALLFLFKAGQRMNNSSSALRLKLCLLYIHSIENDTFSKSTKELLGVISTRPIRIRIFRTQDVNMALLPSCVGLFISYTVIALQFNNVV